MPGASRNFQIASFGLPSGVTWLANVLLELGVYTYNLPMGDWLDRSSGRPLEMTHQFATGDGSMPFFRKAQELPEIVEPLIHGPRVGWSHQWPTPAFLDSPVIVWYRDPRGAAYSQFVRQQRHGHAGSLRTFLTSQWGPTGLSPQDEWALYHLLWLRLVPRDSLAIASFDRAKAEPVAVVRPLLAFLDVPAADAAIERAAAESSVARALSAQATSSRDKSIIRKGDPDEWRSAIPASELELFAGLPADVLGALEGGEELSALLDVPAALRRIEELAGDRIPDGAADHLARLSLFDAEKALRAAELESRAASVALVAFDLTRDLLSPPLFRWLNLSSAIPGETVAAVLAGLSRAAVPELVLRRAAERRPAADRRRWRLIAARAARASRLR